jgi:2-haloacid dehalogenase
MGFRCIGIDRGTGRQLLPDYQPDATVRTLDEIPALLGKWFED